MNSNYALDLSTVESDEVHVYTCTLFVELCCVGLYNYLEGFSEFVYHV